MTPEQSQFPKISPRATGDQVARVIQQDKNKKLVGAKEAVKKKLLHAILQQAVDELGAPDAIAQAVMGQVGPSHDTIRLSSSALRAMMIDEVGRQALTAIADPAATARSARQGIANDHQAIRQARSTLRTMLSDEVSQQVLADAAVIAAGARDQIDSAHPAIAQAQTQLLTLLQHELADQGLVALSDADSIAKAAVQHIGHDHVAVLTVLHRLKGLVMDDVAKRAMDALSDAGQVARQAKGRIGTDHTALTAASGVLRELLIEEVAMQATEQMQDLGDVARQAKQRIGRDHEAIIGALGVLREMLLEELARRSAEDLSDTDTTARQARERVDLNHDHIVSASSALHKLIVQYVAERSTNALSNADAVADEAMAYIDPNNAHLRNAQSTVKDRMLFSMLSDAVSALDVTADIQLGLQDATPAAPPAPEAVDVSAVDVAPPAAFTPPSPQAEADAFAAEAEAEIEETIEIEAEAEVIEPEAEVTEPEAEVTEPEAEVTEPEAEVTEPEAEVIEPEAEVTEPEAEVIEAEAEVIEPEAEVTEPEAEVTEPEAEYVEYVEPEAEYVESEVVEAEVINEADAIVEDNTFDSTFIEPEIPALTFTPMSFDDDMDDASFIDMTGDVMPAEAPAPIEGEQKSWTKLSEFAAPIEPVSEAAPEVEAPEAIEPTPAPAPAPAPAPVAAVPDADDACVYYVYGIVPREAAGSLQGMTSMGIDPEKPVYGVQYKHLLAIVSKVAAKAFGTLALKKNMTQTTWVKQHARTHANVLDRLRASGRMVPLPFGQVVSSEKAVQALLSSKAEAYSDALARLEAKEEWGLRMYQDREQLWTRIEESNQKVEESLGAISKGVARFVKDEMNKISGGDEDEELTLLSNNCAQRCHRTLEAKASEARSKPVMRTGKGEMVLNTAYLVAEDQAEDFKATVQVLADAYAEMGFKFELTGPRPPYHFVEPKPAA